MYRSNAATRSTSAPGSGHPGLAITTLLAVVLAVGCAAAGTTEEGTPGEPTTAAATARIVNEQPENFTIHLMTAVNRHRLGLATGNGTTTFEIGSAMLGGGGSIHLVADPVGSGEIHRSADIQVRVGDLVEWTLRANPALSRGTIRVRGG